MCYVSTEGALGKLTNSLRQSVASFYSLLGTSAVTDGLWRPTGISRLDLQHLVESEIYWRGRREVLLVLQHAMLCRPLLIVIYYPDLSSSDLLPVFSTSVELRQSICPTLEFDLS